MSENDTTGSSREEIIDEPRTQMKRRRTFFSSVREFFSDCMLKFDFCFCKCCLPKNSDYYLSDGAGYTNQYFQGDYENNILEVDAISLHSLQQGSTEIGNEAILNDSEQQTVNDSNPVENFDPEHFGSKDNQATSKSSEDLKKDAEVEITKHTNHHTVRFSDLSHKNQEHSESVDRNHEVELSKPKEVVENTENISQNQKEVEEQVKRDYAVEVCDDVGQNYMDQSDSSYSVEQTDM